MKKAVVAVVLFAVAVAAGLAWWQSRRAEPGLLLAGTVEARTVEVGSLVGGRVARVLVDEGAEVAAGAVLAELDDPLLPPRIAGQRAAVETAKAALALALAGPRSEARDRARIAWEAAKTDLGRIEALYEDGVVGRQEYDTALVREATAKRTWEEASRGSRSEEIAAARAELERQEALLAELERRRAELTIVAPAAGRIEAFELRPGDLVAANQPVATLLEPGELWVRVYVPETALGHVAVGQEVAVEVDSFPGRTFPGRIVEVRHLAEYLPRNVQTLDQRADQVFGVKVDLAGAEDLRPGMAARVRLPVPESSG